MWNMVVHHIIFLMLLSHVCKVWMKINRKEREISVRLTVIVVVWDSIVMVKQKYTLILSKCQPETNKYVLIFSQKNYRITEKMSEYDLFKVIGDPWGTL